MTTSLVTSSLDLIGCGRSQVRVSDIISPKLELRVAVETYMTTSVLVVTALVYWNCNLVLTGVGSVVVAPSVIVPALMVDGARVV